MAKDKAKAKANIPEGMKCYKKIGGGSLRFTNRIIKPGQIFWSYPNTVPDAFKDTIEEVAANYKAIVIDAEGDALIAKLASKKANVIKFKVAKAKDEEGVELKKGKKFLYNVVDSDNKVMNDEPLLKGKANELLIVLSE